VRPESVRLADSGGANTVEGRVANASFRGDHVTLEVEIATTMLEVTVAPSVSVGAGQQVRLFVPPDACRVVRPEGEPSG